MQIFYPSHFERQSLTSISRAGPCKLVPDQDRHGEEHMTTEASKAPPRSLSPAAERMRRHRKRRRNGLLCLRILLRETEIDAQALPRQHNTTSAIALGGIGLE